MKLGVACLPLACLALAACTGAGPGSPTDRPTARGFVLRVSEGVRVADETCAAVSLQLNAHDHAKAVTVADACAHGYVVARRALLAAESAVNAYEAGGDGRWACATRDALTGLREMDAAIVLAGAPVPSAVADGLSVASALVGLACVDPPDVGAVDVGLMPPSWSDAGQDANDGSDAVDAADAAEGG